MIQVRFLKLAEHLSWRVRNCIRLFLQETVFDILTVLPYQEQKTFRRQVKNLSQTECFLLSKGMVFVWGVSVVSIFAIKMSIKAKLLLRFLNQAELAKVLCRRDCQEGPDGGRYDRSAAGVGLTSIGGEGPQGPGDLSGNSDSFNCWKQPSGRDTMS